MGEMPDWTVIVAESWLTNYHGGLDEILKQLLVMWNYSLKVLVQEFAYSDGRILVKYRVSVQLPKEIGSGYSLPYGESRIS
jgi:hypothetical protein